MAIQIRRRQLLAALGGAAAWPFGVYAEQPERMRRIGVLMNTPTDSSEGHAGVATFRETLQQLGWIDGRDVRIDTFWSANDVDLNRRYAADLITRALEILLASCTLCAVALEHATRLIPIVFVQVSDPVGAGLVDSLPHPGRNITGFMNFEYSLSGKWLELLRRIAPHLVRVVVVRDPDNPAGIAQFGAIQALAHSLGVEVRPVNVREANEIETALTDLAHATNGGLIVTPGGGTSVHHKLIIALAAKYKLPAVYSDRFIVVEGGLLSYGPDRMDQFRRAAGYVDRILKGEKPGDMPVQVPSKYELVINLKTAQSLGLETPPQLLAQADEVIE